MIRYLRNFFSPNNSLRPNWTAAAGGLLFMGQIIYYARSQLSRLDEGLYQVKGYFFAIGKYMPFGEYGPITNHMPLSFLIPGYFQAWFGPSVAAARIFAIFLSALFIIGVWMTAKRLSSKWMAGLAVWAFALNVAIIRVYSMGLSQVLIAAMLVWSLFFTLGKDRKRWEYLLGTGIAGLALMTRINIAPWILFVGLYIWWQHGFKEALLAALVGFVVVGGLHALYWPGILKMWAYWVPKGLLPFLADYYEPWRKTFTLDPAPLSTWIFDLESPYWNRIVSFWFGVRFNFVSLLGVAIAFIGIIFKRKAFDQATSKIVVLLLGGFSVLFYMHFNAALGGNSCHFFCFYGYLMFFNVIGILLLILSIKPFLEIRSGWGITITSLFFGFLVVGAIYGAYQDIGNFLINIPIPRVSGGTFPLYAPFVNKYDLSFFEIRQIVSAITGVLVFGLLITLAVLFWKRKQTNNDNPQPFMYYFGLLVLIPGLILSPTPILGGGEVSHICGGNTWASYQAAGEKLASVIQPQSKIYWRGGQSIFPMLWLAEAEFYGPQMNDVFTFANTGGPHDPDELYRYGLWNEELKEQWIEEADYILVEGRRYAEEWQAMVESGEFVAIMTTPPTELCRGDDARIVVLVHAAKAP